MFSLGVTVQDYVLCCVLGCMDLSHAFMVFLGPPVLTHNSSVTMSSCTVSSSIESYQKNLLYQILFFPLLVTLLLIREYFSFSCST